jgi:[acyl-carrier-protein] S-malonyltransferase
MNMNKLTCVFPGQGSQFVGMLSELAETQSSIISIFNEVSHALGWDVWELVQDDPLNQIDQTEYTQVAMLTAGVAVFTVLQENGMPMPVYMTGHSLGEYAALVCAKAIPLSEAAKLVQRRGQLMQAYVPLGKGGMAAIVGLGTEIIEEICQKVSSQEDQVTPANYNAIGQVVIAGHLPAVMQAITLAEKAGARLAKLIPVSVPCHCPLLIEAASAFEKDLQNAPFTKPKINVISNVDLSIYHDPDNIRKLLKKQLYMPVRWVEIIQNLTKNGVSQIIECGPGKVLNGLIKRIDKTLDVLSVNDNASLELFKSKYN